MKKSLHLSLVLLALVFAGCGPDMTDYQIFLKANLLELRENGMLPDRTFTIEKDGPHAPLMQSMHNFMKEQAENAQWFRKTTQGTHFDSYVRPEQLVDADAIAYAKKCVTHYHYACEQRDKKMQMIEDYYLEEIAGLDIDPIVIKEFLKGTKKEKRESDPKIRNTRDALSNYTQSVLNILTFMERKTDVCKISRAGLVFENVADSNRYESLRAEMLECRRKYYECIDKHKKSVEKTIKKIDSYIKWN